MKLPQLTPEMMKKIAAALATWMAAQGTRTKGMTMKTLLKIVIVAVLGTSGCDDRVAPSTPTSSTTKPKTKPPTSTPLVLVRRFGVVDSAELTTSGNNVYFVR